MKASELRIGNWVTYAGMMQRVYSIGETAINIAQDPLKISFIGGVELSPEILVKMGFENYQKSFYNFYKIRYTYYKIRYTHILLEKELTIMELDEGLYNWMEGNANVHIYYVHQLQNLYQILTNTELNFTL